jgi:hypothetical protein
MLRTLQAVLCAAALVLVSGCKQEVKELPPADKDTTPKVSPEQKQKVLDAAKRMDEEAAKKRKEIEKGTEKKDKK